MQTFLLSVTESAKEHLNSIRDGKSIKLGVKSSGCNGFAYVLDLGEQKKEDLIFNDVPFSIDESSMSALKLCTIDYKKDGFFSKIVFENPNVTHSCGCGESFSLKKES